MPTVAESFDDAVKAEIFLQDGGLHRCPHGVYLAGEKEKAQYCLSCYPNGPTVKTKKFVMPRSSGDPLELPALRANHKIDTACPKCFCTIYIDLETKRECADCGEKYPTPKRRSHS